MYMDNNKAIPSADILKDGKKYIEEYLKNNSFTNVTTDVWQYGTSNIKADSFGENILVQVNTSIYPNEPDEITGDERIKIISRASLIKREPYAAYVRIGIGKELENIRWEKLN